MSTYQLVGSNYNRYTGQFENEEIITMEDIPLKTLEDIDRFTCQETKFSINGKLPEKYRDKNHFAILLQKNGQPNTYLKVIYDQPELKTIIDSIQPTPVLTYQGYRTLRLVSRNFPLVMNTLRPIQEALEQKDREIIGELVPPEGKISWQIQRFFNSEHTEGAEVEEMNQIMLTARHYPTLRSIYLHQVKVQQDKQRAIPRVTLRTTPPRRVVETPSKVEYHREFGEAYLKEQTSHYNLQEIAGKEYEEFLDIEESATAYGFNDEAEFQKGPRHGRH